MNSDIDPDDATKMIDSFIDQIDSIYYDDYTQGEKDKIQLEIRIKNFVRAAFKDDKDKLQDLEEGRALHRKRILSSEGNEITKQIAYEKDLELLKNHLIGYKDELTLFSNSRKKKSQPQSQENTKMIEQKKYSTAEIRLGGIGGIIGAVIFGSMAYTTYPNVQSVAFCGIISVILSILGIGCFVKPDEFGPTLLLWFENISKSNSPNKGNIEQKQKNPKNSPQIVNYGQLNYGTKPDQFPIPDPPPKKWK